MNKFCVTESLRDSDFNALLLLTNLDAPLTPIDEIEKAVSSLDHGHVLIDQILHAGNSDERFISLDIVGGKVNRDSISFYPIPKGNYIRDISRKLLCKHNLIEFSILSSIQKRMLKKGISI
jgi:hypothetical protein